MADEKTNSDDVLSSVARTVGTAAGMIVSTATRLTAKASKAVTAKKTAKKKLPKKKGKPAAKRKPAIKKKLRKVSRKKR